MLGVINNVNGGVVGSNNTDDNLQGGAEDNLFFVGRGNDIIDGGAGDDILHVDGEVIEWIFTTLENGQTLMTHPTWGANTLNNIESIFFARSGTTLSVQEAIEVTATLPAQRLDSDNVINGTNGDDALTAVDGVQGLYGGVGNDSFDADADIFAQVNYDGVRGEFTIIENSDGSITVFHPIWGTDTLTNIDGLAFTGREPGVDGAQTGGFEFIAIGDIEFDDALPAPAPVTPDPIIPTAVDSEPVVDVPVVDAPATAADDDILIGGLGNDTLTGGAGNDFIDGGAGEDTLLSGGIFGGNDFIIGGADADTFSLSEVAEGVTSHDVIADFQSGEDLIDVSNLDGVSSIDDLFITTNDNGHVAIFISETNSVTFNNLTNPAELSASDFIFDAPAAPTVEPQDDPEPTPEAADNIINGTDSNDDLIGTAEDDIILSSAGDDFIYGGAGNDTLETGGLGGNDFLIGAEGEDSFVFSDVVDGESSHDVIADFNSGEDILDVSGLSGVSSFDDLFITTNDNGNVAIFLSEDQSVTFNTLTEVEQIDASDFLF